MHFRVPGTFRLQLRLSFSSTREPINSSDRRWVRRVGRPLDLHLYFDPHAEAFNDPNQEVMLILERFPEDFIFQVAKRECAILTSQIVTSSRVGRHTIPLGAPVALPKWMHGSAFSMENLTNS